MRESKGFTLVELMIVVAIIGILAAVAVPFYQKYIQKSRLTSMVFPGVHSIQTNIGTYYSFQQEFPPNSQVQAMASDADTDCYLITLTETGGSEAMQIQLTTAQNAARCGALQRLVDMTGRHLVFYPKIDDNKIKSWAIAATTLSTSLGLAGEGDF